MFLVFFPVKRNKRGIIFTCIQSLLKLSWLLYKFHNYLLVSIDAVLVLPSQHLQTSWSSFSLLVIYKTQKYFQFTDTYENQLHLWTTGRTKNIYRQLHVWEQTTNGRTRNIYWLLGEPYTLQTTGRTRNIYAWTTGRNWNIYRIQTTGRTRNIHIWLGGPKMYPDQ